MEVQYSCYRRVRRGISNDYLIGIITPFPTTHYEFLIMNSKLSPLLFPHGGSAVEPAVALAVEAGAGAHVEKERVEGAVCYVDRSACGNEAGAYFDSAAGTVFHIVVERRQVTKVAGVDTYAVITV